MILPMTVDDWLKAAIADAERRGLPELKPLLESLAQATKLLRGADFAGRADSGPQDSESGIHNSESGSRD